MTRKRSNRTDMVTVPDEIGMNPSDETTRKEAYWTGFMGVENSFTEESSPQAAFRETLRTLNQKKWGILAVCLVATLAAGAYAYTRTALYRSVAVIELRGDNGQGGNFGDILTRLSARNRDFETEEHLLRSRSLVGRLVDETKLARGPSLRPTGDGPSGKSVTWFRSLLAWERSADFNQAATAGRDAEREILIDNMLKKMVVAPEPGTRLMALSMVAPDPRIARETLEKYIEIYRDERLARKKAAARKAGALLESEIRRVENRLTESLAAAAKFANKHGFLSLHEDLTYAATFYAKAGAELEKSKNTRAKVEAALSGGHSLIPAGLPFEISPPETEALRTKLAELEDRYARLRLIHAEESPKLMLVRRQISFLKRKIGDLERKAAATVLRRVKKTEKRRKEVYDEAKKEAMNINALGVEYAVLRKDVETNEHIYRLLLKKSKELDLRTQMITSGVGIVDPPSRPEAPVSTNKGMIIACGSFLGLICGILGAVVLQNMDSTVQLSEDFERKVGLPKLGAIPDMRASAGSAKLPGASGSIELRIHDDPSNPLWEAVRSVKTSIFLSTPGKAVGSILVASSTPGEGKTFLSTTIGIAVSTRPAKVILVDCDMRKPRLAKVFGQSGLESGLSTILTSDDFHPEEVICTSPIKGVHYIPSGPLPPNPAALLESDGMRRLSERLKTMYDFVVFDCPPALGFADAQIVAHHAEGIVLVAREGAVPLDMLREATDRLSKTRCPVLGVVLNLVDPSRHPGLAYGYYGYYSHEPTDVGALQHVTKGRRSHPKRGASNSGRLKRLKKDKRNRDFILRL